MEILTADDFALKEGMAFQMIFDEGYPLDLVLTTVRRNKVHEYPGKMRDPFSLFFDGTKGVLCPQGTYRLRDSTGWETDLFLVPVAENPDGSFRYQAVYN